MCLDYADIVPQYHIDEESTSRCDLGANTTQHRSPGLATTCSGPSPALLVVLGVMIAECWISDTAAAAEAATVFDFF